MMAFMERSRRNDRRRKSSDDDRVSSIYDGYDSSPYSDRSVIKCLFFGFGDSSSSRSRKSAAATTKSPSSFSSSTTRRGYEGAQSRRAQSQAATSSSPGAPPSQRSRHPVSDRRTTGWPGQPARQTARPRPVSQPVRMPTVPEQGVPPAKPVQTAPIVHTIQTGQTGQPARPRPVSQPVRMPAVPEQGVVVTPPLVRTARLVPFQHQSVPVAPPQSPPPTSPPPPADVPPMPVMTEISPFPSKKPVTTPTTPPVPARTADGLPPASPTSSLSEVDIVIHNLHADARGTSRAVRTQPVAVLLAHMMGIIAREGLLLHSVAATVHSITIVLEDGTLKKKRKDGFRDLVGELVDMAGVGEIYHQDHVMTQ